MIEEQRWQKAKSVFQAAIELPADQRETFIQQSCDDTAVQDEVRRLLASHFQQGSFLDSPLADDITASGAQEPDDVAGDPGQALALAEPVLSGFQSVRGENDRDTITVRRLLARILIALERPDDAREHLERARTAAVECCGPDSELEDLIGRDLENLGAASRDGEPASTESG